MLASTANLGAQETVFIKEVVSREVSFHVGAVQVPEQKEIISREVSMFIENGRNDPGAEIISREVSLVIDSPGPPAPIPELDVTVSPTGGTVILDWTAYNQWAKRDIDHFKIYFSDQPFTDVSGMTEYTSAGGEATSVTLENLAEFRDHFFAVVPVDAFGNFDSLVNYSAAYIISPEVVSREVSIFIGDEPDPSYRSVTSREISMIIDSPGVPAAITELDVTVSPSGDEVTLDWSGYNQWEQRDVERFDIYFSSAAFSDVGGMDPHATIGAESNSITLGGLPVGTDHFFAVVAVDALGGFESNVTYSAAYVLSPEAISREVSLFVGGEPDPPFQEMTSREISILVPDEATPAPVTGIDSGFTVTTSQSDFGAVDLDWTSYAEIEQRDVVRYRIYVNDVFFDDVTGLTPHSFVNAGSQVHTLAGLGGNQVFHFAVVAEDALGNFDSAVRSFSQQTSVDGVGEVTNPQILSGADTLDFSWEEPLDSTTFLASYHLYFNGSTDPVILPSSVTTWQATGLQPAQSYSLRITTVDNSGKESDGRTIFGATFLTNPSPLTFSTQGETVYLNWDPVTPGSLVSHYLLFRSETPISDISSLTPVSSWFGTRAAIGGFADARDDHFAVATVNLSGGTDPQVVSVPGISDGIAPSIGDIHFDELLLEDGLTVTRSGTLRAVVTDDWGVEWVEFALMAAADGSEAFVFRDVFDLDGFSAIMDLTPFPDGDYTLEVRTVDVFGNTNQKNVSITVALSPPPAPAITIPNDGYSSQGENLAIGGTAWPFAEVFLYRDNVQVAGPISPSPGGTFALNLPLEFGVHTYTGKSVNRAGESPVSNAVTVSKRPPLTLALDSMAVVEGGSVTGTVSTPQAVTSDLPVVVASDRPSQIAVVNSAIIPSGQSSATFALQVLQDDQIEPTYTTTITASATGAAGDSEPLVVGDDDWPTLSLELDRTVISESSPGNTAFARVTRNPVTPVPVQITLESSDPSEVAPVVVTIPGGQAAIDFAVPSVDDEENDGARDVALQAVLALSSGEAVDSNVVNLRVTDDEGPVLVLESSHRVLKEGVSLDVIVRREGTASLDSDLNVDLVSSNPGRLAAPASVVIPSGQTSISFQISSADNGQVDGPAEVNLTATAPGFDVAFREFLVTDESLPELLTGFGPLQGEGLSESIFRVRYDLRNVGVSTTAGPFTQRVFLSEDRAVGDDILLGQEIISDPVSPDETVEKTGVYRLPVREGDYWVIVATDVNGDVAEIDESNNISISATSIRVIPAYSVTVSTDIETVPANTPIPMNGFARKADGQPAGNVTVPVYIRRGDSERTLLVVTESDGSFSVSWQPLNGEGGHYRIAAAHPGREPSKVADQDSFDILTVESDFPDSPLSLDEGGSSVIEATIRNPGPQPLTGLGVTVANAPAGLNIVPTILGGTDLSVGASANVQLSVTATLGATGNHLVELLVTTDQGIELTVSVPVTVNPLVPIFAVGPERLECSVLKGDQKVASFKVTNNGGAETGEIELLLPGLSWLSPVSSPWIPSLAPGESTDVNLLLAPTASTPLTLYEGGIVLRAASGLQKFVPFAFRVVSDLKGDLEIEVVDEFFYFSEEEPRVEGAQVTVRDGVTKEEVAILTTGADGLAFFPDLMEGNYEVEIVSPDHNRFRGNYHVDASELNRERIFVSRELVRYTWTVEEIEVEDRYRVTVESNFETNVPAPVVTVSPGVLELGDMTQIGHQKVVNFTITNHGFIAAHEGFLHFGEHPFYEITPLVDEVGLIPAKTSIVVPVTIRRIGEKNNIPKKNAIPCRIVAGCSYSYPCGPRNVAKSIPIAVNGVAGDCPPRPSAPRHPTGGGGGWGSSPSVTRVTFATPTRCDCPWWLPDWRIDLDGYLNLDQLIGGFKKALKKHVPETLRNRVTLEPDLRIEGDIDFGICCENGDIGIDGTGEVKLVGKVELGLDVLLFDDILEDLVNDGIEDRPRLEIGQVVFSPALDLDLGVKLEQSLEGGLTLEKKCNEDPVFCGEAGYDLRGFAGVEGEVGIHIRNKESNIHFGAIVEGQLGPEINAEIKATYCRETGWDLDSCFCFLLRHHLKGKIQLEALQYPPEWFDRNADLELPPTIANVEGEVIEFRNLDYKVACTSTDPAKYDCGLPETKSKKKVGNPKNEEPTGPELITHDLSDLPTDFVRDEAEILDSIFPEGNGVCAKVKIQLDQEAVVTRSAFRASLTLENEQPEKSLEWVGFELDVRDQAGVPANEHFHIRVSRLDGLPAIDGSANLGPNSDVTAHWTLIPRDSAAPDASRVYTVGGSIRYTLDGTELTIPVSDVPITVNPDAALTLRYFHQRDVLADDPHTDPVEAAVPFALGVMIENNGAGAANNLSITSAQPKIVENEKGLLIDFVVIGSQVEGQPGTGSLTADFGTIQPGERKIGTWLLTSTLQGLFTEYNATFEHIDGLGDPRISLIKNVEIHETIRMFDALGAHADGRPDFLVNDVPDVHDYPDTVYLSDGSTAPVSLIEAGTISGSLGGVNPSVTLTIDASPGWAYVRIPDPGDGDFTLSRVVRSDGLEIPVPATVSVENGGLEGLGNAWMSDRTFVGLGQRPTEENVFHLIDWNSTGEYTLHYAPVVGIPDEEPPVSQVEALANDSGERILVSWSGSDDVAVAHFDIHVSVDGGPWELWMERTLLRSTMYIGEPNRRYSFYSVATDTSGRVENAPGEADATTTVTLGNLPPVLDVIPDQTISEGEIFSLGVSASDPDGEDRDLRFSVLSDSPGLVIDPVSGQMTWNTGETDGGRSFTTTVTVTDGGDPAGSTNQSFTLTALEVNQPPRFDPMASQTVEVDGLMIAMASAVDLDSPEQPINYRLGPDSPDGVTVDEANGLITWTPGIGYLDETVRITVIADDGQGPDGIAMTEFTVSVVERAESQVSSFAAWAEGYGITGERLFFAQDEDGDGIDLLTEYAFGFNPLRSDYRVLAKVAPTGGMPLFLMERSGDGEKLIAEFLRRINDPNLEYIAEFSNDLTLGTGAWEEVDVSSEISPIGADWERVKVEDVEDSESSSRRFGRIRVRYHEPSAAP